MSDIIVASIIAASAAVSSGVVTALIAYGGIKLTAKTSMASNSRLAEVAERNNSAVVKSSCESKIAEMRVHWNDDLRTALAKFGAAIAAAVSALSTGASPNDGDKQYWYVYIILKLNQSDETHRNLIKILGEMMTYVNRLIEEQKNEAVPSGKSERDKFQELFTRYSKTSSAILKHEWDRAKKETREAWVNSNYGAM